MKKIILIFMAIVYISLGDIAKIHQEALNIYKEGDVVEAIELLEKNGVNDKKIFEKLSDKKAAMILNDYAYFLMKAERYEESKKILELVKTLDKSRYSTYYNLAEVNEKLGDIVNVKVNLLKYLITVDDTKIIEITKNGERIIKEKVPKKLRKYLTDEDILEATLADFEKVSLRWNKKSMYEFYFQENKYVDLDIEKIERDFDSFEDETIEIYLPNVKEIGKNFLLGGKGQIYMPNLLKINGKLEIREYENEELYLPKLNYINGSIEASKYNYGLKRLLLPKLESVEDIYAHDYSDNGRFDLIDLKSITIINKDIIMWMDAKKIFFNNLERVEGELIIGGSTLEEVNLSRVRYIEKLDVSESKNLKRLILPSLEKYTDINYNYCPNLEMIQLGKNIIKGE